MSTAIEHDMSAKIASVAGLSDIDETFNSSDVGYVVCHCVDSYNVVSVTNVCVAFKPELLAIETNQSASLVSFLKTLTGLQS